MIRNDDNGRRAGVIAQIHGQQEEGEEKSLATHVDGKVMKELEARVRIKRVEYAREKVLRELVFGGREEEIGRLE